jgi:predicted RNA-binding protein YlqC (UPF0109 family)
MTKRISEIADNLRQLGDLPVTDWDLKGLLNTDLKDLEIASTLRKLGNRKVLEWDFKEALPAVHKLAHREVDLVGWLKRVAHYKVMEWDFRSSPAEDGGAAAVEAAAPRRIPEPDEMRALIQRLRHFLQFVTVNLIDEADRARIQVEEIGPGMLRFTVVVTQRDLKTLLGREGVTAAAIRNLLKLSAAAEGVSALLQLLSHEELRALAKKAGKSAP